MTRLLDRLAAGNVLVIWKLDRLSRSLKDLLLILERIGAAGAGFRYAQLAQSLKGQNLSQNAQAHPCRGREAIPTPTRAEFIRAVARWSVWSGAVSATIKLP
ncbi:MAG TPA: recombinase family protein [Steroidobacteraceae bacterium]|nr:recombinase family protein [Steroidobacteraceae bacterium]